MSRVPPLNTALRWQHPLSDRMWQRIYEHRSLSKHFKALQNQGMCVKIESKKQTYKILNPNELKCVPVCTDLNTRSCSCVREDKKFSSTLAYFLKRGLKMFTSPAYKLKMPACFATQRVNRQCTFKAGEWVQHPDGWRPEPVLGRSSVVTQWFYQRAPLYPFQSQYVHVLGRKHEMCTTQ